MSNNGPIPWIADETRADGYSDNYFESLGLLWFYPTGANDPNGSFAAFVNGSTLTPG